MNKYELIEKYFSNGLSAEEFQQLEQFLENDSQLRDEFYNELEIKRSIAQEKHTSLKNRFQELDNKVKKKTNWLPYAAAIALLIGIGTFIYNLQPNYQDLYAENFEVYPNVISPTTRSEVSNTDNLAKAFSYYEAGNYSDAANAFNEAYKNNPADYLLFYKGVSLLAQNETEEGIGVLQSYDWELHKSEFSAASNWYLGLAHLKQEQPHKAQSYLKKVANSESNLSKPAQELLKKLD